MGEMKSDIDIAREKGMKIINDLPNIKDLRDRALSLHRFSMKQLKEGHVPFSKVKYGFTQGAYNSLLNLTRDYAREYIHLQSHCNCDIENNMKIGDTFMILLDGSHHLSWCNQAKETEQKLAELKERFP